MKGYCYISMVENQQATLISDKITKISGLEVAIHHID